MKLSPSVVLSPRFVRMMATHQAFADAKRLRQRAAAGDFQAKRQIAMVCGLAELGAPGAVEAAALLECGKPCACESRTTRSSGVGAVLDAQTLRMLERLEQLRRYRAM